MINLNTFFLRIMSINPVQRQSIISLFWKMAFTAIGFVSTMYFAHTVGASILGAYFLFTAYYGIIGIVTDGGFGGAATKRISEGEEPDAFFSAFFILRSLFVTFVVIALIILRGYFVDLNTSGTFVWLLLALIISILHGSVASGVVGCGKMGVHATCEFINNFSRIIIQVIAVFLGFGVAGLAGGFVAGMLIGALLELRFFDLHFMRFGIIHIKSLLSFSFWLFLTNSGMMVFSYADTIIIGYYLDNTEIGVYRVILQFAAIGAFTTSAIRGSLWPKVSRWGKVGDFRLIETSFSRALTYSFLLAVPTLTGGVLLGDRLLYYFYGSEFERGYTILIIFLILQLVNIFNLYSTMYLNALDRAKDSFKVTAIGVTANIALNLLLIPILGIKGAAIATLLTMTLNAIIFWRVLAKIFTLRIEFNSFLNIMKASLIMSIFIFGYRLIVPLSNVWLTLIPVILGGIMYGILVLKFDLKIHDELKKITLQMNLPWPNWL